MTQPQTDQSGDAFEDARLACWLAALCMQGGTTEQGVAYLWDAYCALHDRRALTGASAHDGSAAATSSAS